VAKIEYCGFIRLVVFVSLYAGNGVLVELRKNQFLNHKHSNPIEKVQVYARSVVTPHTCIDTLTVTYF